MTIRHEDATRQDVVTQDATGPDAWTVAQAKAHFSALLHRVDSTGPQVITRRGEQVAIVVSFDEWHRKTRRTGSLADFFASSPLAGSGLSVSRDHDEAREPTL